MKENECILCQRVQVKGLKLFKEIIDNESNEGYICTNCIEKGRLELNNMRLKKKCKYYVVPNGCSHLNELDDLGECIYIDGIINNSLAIHCSQSKKIPKTISDNNPNNVLSCNSI